MPFFDKTSPLYIDEFSSGLKEDFATYLGTKRLSFEKIFIFEIEGKSSTISKEKVLQKAYEEVEKYISKYFLPSFLFSYGV